MGRNLCTDWRITQYLWIAFVMIWLFIILIINVSITSDGTVDEEVLQRYEDAHQELNDANLEYESFASNHDLIENGDVVVGYEDFSPDQKAVYEYYQTYYGQDYADAYFLREANELIYGPNGLLDEAQPYADAVNNAKANVANARAEVDKPMNYRLLKQRLLKGFTYSGLFGAAIGLFHTAGRSLDEKKATKFRHGSGPKLGDGPTIALIAVGILIGVAAIGFSISGCVKSISIDWTLKTLPVVAYAFGGTLGVMALSFLSWDLIKHPKDMTRKDNVAPRRLLEPVKTSFQTDAVAMPTVCNSPVNRIWEAINANQAL